MPRQNLSLLSKGIARHGAMRFCRYVCVCVLFLSITLGVTRVSAETVTITSFQNDGMLTWTNAAITGWQTVEWASSLTGTWHRTWYDLTNLRATGGVATVEVPLFYRVAWSSNAMSGVPASDIIGLGDGANAAFDAYLAHIPVIAGSVVVRDGVETFTDPEGDGTLDGTAGGTGTISYATGHLVVTFDKAPQGGNAVVVTYEYGPLPSWLGVSSDVIGTGNGVNATFEGTLTHMPVVKGSVVVSDGIESFTDPEGDGTLAGTSGGNGTISYGAGHVLVNFFNSPGNGKDVRVNYSYGEPPVEPPITVINVIGETNGVGNGTSHVYSGSLGHAPVVTNSVSLTAGGFVFTDKGNGLLGGNVTNSSGHIHYSTGAWFLDLGTNVFAPGLIIYSTYQYPE
jgi:hypothetical protein